MLHIPFDKRGLITTQRFSISGVPRLHLSTISLGCWLEVNIPQLELFQVLDMNRSFKSEYIIFQLLMQVVNELWIDGVAYLPKK